MTGIVCAILGHKAPHYGGSPHYADQPKPSIWTDGTGRGHVDLYGKCDRCGKRFKIISFHPPKEWISATRGTDHD